MNMKEIIQKAMEKLAKKEIIQKDMEKLAMKKMKKMKKIIQKAMKALAKKKMIFCSEGDFQYHLANAIKKQGKGNLEIFLEYKWIDICVYDKTEKQKYFIELKYKTSELKCERYGMEYFLTNQYAQNNGRHDFFEDINKLENIENIEEENLVCSFALFLTNEHLYWDRGDKGKGEDFCIKDEREIKGEITYKYTNSNNENSKHTAPVKIKNTYNCEWVQYLLPKKDKNSEFKYLLLQIPPEEENMN